MHSIICVTIGGHNYLIKKLIGKGAFAIIYLAIDDKGDKKALKVVSNIILSVIHVTTGTESSLSMGVLHQ